MKKLLSLALVLVLAFSLVACSKPAENKPADQGTESVPADQADSVQTGEKATMTGDEVVAFYIATLVKNLEKLKTLY